MINLNCPVCGEQLEAQDDEAGQPISCDNCGESCRVPGSRMPKTTAPLKPATKRSVNNSERVYYNQGGIRITTTRAVFGGQIYAINGMTSIRMARINPERFCPLLLLLLGLALFGGCGLVPLTLAMTVEEKGAPALFGVVMMLAGVGLAGMGIWLLRTQKPRYAVVIRTSSGEVKALVTRKAQAVEQIVEALSQAFADRG
jgi:hypothetical protein